MRSGTVITCAAPCVVVQFFGLTVPWNAFVSTVTLLSIPFACGYDCYDSCTSNSNTAGDFSCEIIFFAYENLCGFPLERKIKTFRQASTRQNGAILECVLSVCSPLDVLGKGCHDMHINLRNRRKLLAEKPTLVNNHQKFYEERRNIFSFFGNAEENGAFDDVEMVVNPLAPPANMY